MIKLLYIDLFCGAGGTSTGVEKAKYKGEKCAKVIACVNHDANAIASHAANHPDALHFTEDIRTLELSLLVSHIEKMKAAYPEAPVVLWASLECTNFSKAKGGQPRDADSRTLAEHLFRYIEAINPDYIQIENVEEFMCWGDLDEKGKPVSREKGKRYLQWVEHVKQYGYTFKHQILNAADYGAYTSRKRFFGIFAKNGLPIVFPQPTHTKQQRKSEEPTLFEEKPLKKWKPVKDVLDFTNEGESIFTRKKPLVDATLERIYAGLIKFVASGKDNFLSAYYGRGKNFESRINRTAKSIDDPCGVLTAHNRFAKVQCRFIQQRNGGKPGSKIVSVDGPARTLTATGGNQEVVSAHFLTKYYSGRPGNKCQSVNVPAGTVRTKDCFSLLRTEFLSAYYGNGHNHGIDEPAPTVTCKDSLAKIHPTFFMNYYSGGGQLSGTDKPCPTVMPVPKQCIVGCKFIDQQYGNSKPSSAEQPLGCITANSKYNLVSCRSWLMNTSFNNVGSTIDNPAPVITANRKWHYLMNPQFGSPGSSVDNPCFTLIARMDKMPPYLVTTETGQLAIEVYETDSEPMRRIKQFMALYGIIDIKMRMLKIPELKRIMGFPEDYTLIGTQAEQKKYIGNAVEVNMARVLCEALVTKLYEMRIKITA